MEDDAIISGSGYDPWKQQYLIIHHCIVCGCDYVVASPMRTGFRCPQCEDKLEKMQMYCWDDDKNSPTPTVKELMVEKLTTTKRKIQL